MSKKCPNYNTCKLVNTDKIAIDNNQKEKYIQDYCLREETWRTCMRYTTKRSLWFCPDWVLPDSKMTEDEIIERAESEMKKS